MTKATNRNFLLSLLLCMALVFAFAMTMPTHNVAYAEEVSTFIFTPTSDTECSVRLSNKTVDKAIVPERALINGNEYTVTSIAGNGFASASNLKKVRLPKTVKTIGNSAFANCSALNSITLTAVESIGTSAFNLCTSLQYLIIPETMITVAPTILRNCNTQVYVRTSESKTQELGWAANWNASNANQAVEFSSTFTPEVEYVEVYNNSARSYSSNAEIIGYYVADDQPFREEREDDVYVYIPDVYQGQPVMGIMDTAFLYNNITYLTIGYAEAPLHIDSYAFNGLDGNVVTINRDINIDVIDWQGNEQLAEFLFADSSVSTVILPDSISGFGPYMFSGCANLTDIHFLTPRERTGKTEEENIKNEFTSTQIVNLPTSTTFSKICTEAFSGTSGLSELNIPKNVTTVEEFAFIGWNLPQTISIAFEQEANLPQWDANLKQGWHPNWKEGCPSNVIQFQGEYAITYHLNGGTHSGNPTTYTSKDNTYLNDASRLGYTFNGWYNNSSFSGDSVSVIEKGSSGDKELYAKWTANEYTIRFNSNKPSLASANILGSTALSEHVFDISKALSQNGFSLAGWTFQSWNTKADGSGMSYANAETIENLLSENNAEMTLFAQWTPIQYSVIYNNNKPSNARPSTVGVLSGTMDSSTHTYDTTKKLNTNGFILTGWTFIEWNTTPNGSGTSCSNNASVKNLTSTKGGTIDLYAQWKINEYSITYEDLHYRWSESEPWMELANPNASITSYTIDTPTIKFVQPEPGVGVTFTWTTTEIRKGSTGNMFIGLSYRKHTYTLQAVYGGDLVGYSAPVKTIVVTYDDIIDISCKVEEDGGKYIFDHWERDGNNIGSTNALKLTRLTPYDGGFVRIVAVYYKKSCVAEGTMITLADGSQKAVEMLTGEEELLVWNLKTGQFDTSPIIFIDSDPLKEYEVINLQFSDNTSVKVIYEHAFWDFDLNQYVFLRKDAAQYIGHWFQKQIINANGNLAYTRVKLTNVTITTEMTTSWIREQCNTMKKRCRMILRSMDCLPMTSL